METNMTVFSYLHQSKTKTVAFVVMCIVAASLTTVAAAQPAVEPAAPANSCGIVGNASDNGGDVATPVGPVAQPGVAVAHVGDHSTSSDTAVKTLYEHTELLRHSADVDPTVNNGSLDPGCGVAFELEGTSNEIGAVGITGLQINDDSRWLVQGLQGNRGYRMMAVLENSQAATTYTVNLKLDDDITVESLANGGAVFIKNGVVNGSILAPWALDAKGQTVPITQTVTSTQITINVDTTNVTNWPVIADPEYHTLNCTGRTTTNTGTAADYVLGIKCPLAKDILKRGYSPVWIEHFNHWTVGKQHGDCSGGLPERLDTWNPQDVKDIIFTVGLQVSQFNGIPLGVIYDFTQACKTHDYCYDLGHTQRLNYARVTRIGCDFFFTADSLFDCSKRRGNNRPSCALIAGAALSVIRAAGWVGWGLKGWS